MSNIVTWRLVLARTRADWLVTAAAALVILVATTLLSAGLIYADAVTLQGLRRALADASVREANLQVISRITPTHVAAADTALRGAVLRTVRGVHVGVARVQRSDSFALPQQPAAGVRNLAVFGSYQEIEKHASLVDGSWPTARSGRAGPLAVVVPARLSQELTVAVGNTLTMTSRLDPTRTVQVRVTGVYRIDDRRDPYWWDEPMELEGATVSPNYTTYGPLILAQADFPSVGSVRGNDVAWRLFPNLGALELDGISPLRGDIARIDGAVTVAIRGDVAGESAVDVASGLGALLSDVQLALLATRTGVLLLLVQLVALAAFALLLTAALLVEQRRVETSMLHARGAHISQIVVLSLLEGVLLAVPAAVAAPWLAAVSLRLFNGIGPLADIGLHIDPRVSPGAYLVAGLGAALAIVALVVPTVPAARSLSAASRAKGRQARRGMAQRVGLDIALLVGAGVGLWQLRTYGGVLTSSVRGGLGIDPLLVAAPAIGLVAGSILALRLIPLLAQGAETVVARRRGAVASLGAWQLARRPLRYSRAALLLTLTVALGCFATLYIATWSGSQRDQAAHQVGADLRVEPDHRSGAIPLTALPGAYAALPGLVAAMPARRDSLSLFASGGATQLLALDAAKAAQTVSWRSDAAGQPLADLVGTLTANRPTLEGPSLPGSPVRVALDVALALDPLPSGAGGLTPTPPTQITVRVLLLDGAGLIHLVAMGDISVETGRARLVSTVGSAGGASHPWLGMAGPVRLLSVNASVDLANPAEMLAGRLTVTGVQASDSGVGSHWTAADLGGNWTVDQPGAAIGTVKLAPAGNGQLAMHIDAGPSQFPASDVEFALDQAGLRAGSQQPIPVLVNGAFLALSGSTVGSTLTFDLGAGPRPALIAGLVTDFPTLDPTSSLVVVDLQTLELGQAQSGRLAEPDEWWISVRPTSNVNAASSLRARPFASTAVLDLRERAAALQTDPLALGVIGALTLGFVAAALFAAIGFAVSAAVSTRERLTEFAVLRALGLSQPQLAGWLGLEHALLVAISLISGTGLGLLLGWLVLPFATMKRDPGPVLPTPTLAVPWASIAALDGLVVGVLLITVLILVGLLRRVGLGTALRLGEG